MAEARITDDVATNPVMEGDKIYSQVWSPGRQVGFAITGIIDMDGDGRSDLDRLKSVIALNNGKVDAVPGPNGTIAGQMSVDTRYLILGDHPDKPRQEQVRLAWDRMCEEGDTLGIGPITLHDFLQLMGWQSGRRTVKLGIGAQSKDFAATKEDMTTLKRSRRTDSFRPRKPQPTY